MITSRSFLGSVRLVAIAAGSLAAAAAAEPAKLGEPRVLFDGSSLDGWVRGNGEAIESGWVIDDGALHRKERGGDIFTEDEFADFVLEFEWKVAPGANSGVKYRVADYGGQRLGPEYQVLDDSQHRDGGSAKTSSAAIYALIAAAEDKPLKEPGEWNRGKIVAIGDRLEHWLNGKKVAEADVSSEEFAQAAAASKFAKVEGFARREKGKIMLQDHGDPVWFRNIVLTPVTAGQ